MFFVQQSVRRNIKMIIFLVKIITHDEMHNNKESIFKIRNLGACLKTFNRLLPPGVFYHFFQEANLRRKNPDARRTKNNCGVGDVSCFLTGVTFHRGHSRGLCPRRNGVRITLQQVIKFPGLST